MRHFAGFDASLLPDPRGRPPVPHGLRADDRRPHRDARRHHDRRAAGRPPTTRRRWASSASTPTARSSAFEEKPSAARLGEMGSSQSRQARPSCTRTPTSRSSPRWASTCSRATCSSRCWSGTPTSTSASEIIPAVARPAPRAPVPVPRLLGRRGHHPVLLRRQPAADAARGALQLLRPQPAHLHAAALPAGVALQRRATSRRRWWPRAASSISAESSESVVGMRTRIDRGARISPVGAARGRLLRERGGRARAPHGQPPLGIGRDVVLDRVIVDKNARIGDGARLVNEARRRPRRRPRLPHPQRHHHRAQGRRGGARNGGVTWRGPSR